MDIDLKLIFIAATIIIATSSCGKLRLNCANTVFSFQTGIRAYPDKDSIRIGDTIWFESSIPVSLVDLATKQLIDYSGAANLGTAISVDRFIGGSVSDPGSAPALSNFNYILSNGTPVVGSFPDRVGEYLFVEKNKQYIFKIGVIAKKKGTYILGIGNSKNVYRNSDKCTKATYFINFESTNQHLYLYQKNRPGYIIEGLELTNAYCFKVY